MDKFFAFEEDLKVLLENIRKNNRLRLLLFGVFLLSFLVLMKWGGIKIPLLTVGTIFLLFSINLFSEFLVKYIWPKQAVIDVNSGYFIIQMMEVLVFFLGFYLIEAILLKEITFPALFPFTLIAVAMVYILSGYFAFTRRIYSEIIALIFMIGYGTLGLLVYFGILGYEDFDVIYSLGDLVSNGVYQNHSLFFLNIFWTIGLFVCLVFYGDFFSKKFSNILESFKAKTFQLSQKENQILKKEEEFRESKSFLEKEIGTKIKEIKDLTESLNETQNREKELQEKIEESKKFQATAVNQEVQRKLKQGKERILEVINGFHDGVLVFDKENKLFLINPQAELIFEKNSKEVIGKTTSELTKISNFKSVLNLLKEKEEKIFKKEIPMKKNLILEMTITPLIKNNEKIGTLIILHDVTREKEIERIKSEFVTLSAHQLRTPLSAIKWSLKMLLDEDLGKLTKEQREFIEKTYRSNERMIFLINDLLNITRIEEGRHIYQFLFCDFLEITQSVIDYYREEMEKKKIQFEFKKPTKKLPKILADGEKIKLVIENLLNNAIRYTFPGGKIVISINLLEKEVEFKIEDTGIGIPKDEQPRVFTKFFRGVNAIRLETEGSGLGLFVTKNIIEAHGGKIVFKSGEGKGSIFYFVLPIKSTLSR